MKKLLFALLGFVFAVPFAAADNIKMVTYFPVPYASYGDLSVSGTCDVGLLNTCSLNAGEKLNVYKLSSDGRVLNTGSLIANSGKLDLNSSASSSQINTTSLVSHNPGSQTATTGVLEFSHDLTVDTLKNATIQSAKATNRADMDALYLFSSSHRFPTCDGTGHKMSWQKLTVDGKSGVFLVCGKGTEVEEDHFCESGKVWSDSENKCVCSSNIFCMTGYTFNEDTCTCEADTSCSDGKVYNPLTGECECGRVMACADGYTWNSNTCTCQQTLQKLDGTWACTPTQCKASGMPSGACSTSSSVPWLGSGYNDSMNPCPVTCMCTNKIGSLIQ